MTHHPPQQARSRATLERILASARDLFAERGVEAVSIQEIVAHADSSVGSFYARFDGKDDLVRLLSSQVASEAESRWEEALAAREWEGLSTRELIEAVVRLLVRSELEGREERAALQEAVDRAGLEGEGAQEAFLSRMRDDLVRILLEREADIERPDPERAVRTALLMVEGAAERLADRSGGLIDDDWIAELAAAATAHLLGGEPADSGGASPDPFDVWG